MLTNTTAPARIADPDEVTATTIAIEDAERRWRAALRDIARLADAGEIDADEALSLQAESAARYTALARELELRGEDIATPERWARYEACAARRRAAMTLERRRSPRLRGPGPRARALRERQMRVVASARVGIDVLRGLVSDEDDERLAVRRELAAAGLL